MEDFLLAYCHLFLRNHWEARHGYAATRNKSSTGGGMPALFYRMRRHRHFEHRRMNDARAWLQSIEESLYEFFHCRLLMLQRYFLNTIAMISCTDFEYNIYFSIYNPDMSFLDIFFPETVLPSPCFTYNCTIMPLKVFCPYR